MEADFDLAIDLSIYFRCDPTPFLTRSGPELHRILNRLTDRLEERKRVMDEQD